MLFQIVTIALVGSMSIIWSLVFLPVSLFGWKLQILTGPTMSKFLTKVKHASIWENGTPGGWIIGYPFIGCVLVSEGERAVLKKIYLLTTESYYSSDITTGSKKGGASFTVAHREGQYWHLRYTKTKYSTKRVATPKQRAIIEDLIADYGNTQNSVCVLYGSKGTGKSMIPLLLCKELAPTMEGVYYTKSFDPTKPNDNMSEMYGKLSPSEKLPLVVVLEEFDQMIDKIHHRSIPPSKHLPIQVEDKTGWNMMLDDIDRGLFPHMYFIMTTNKPIEWFDAMDTSYLRNGRVSLIREVTL